MEDTEVTRLLTRFADGMSAVAPPAALWAHGSLALGDFRPGRSDLDLVALTDAPLTPVQEERLRDLHRRIVAEEPLGGSLHCTYLPLPAVADTTRPHPTWALGEWFERPVTPVARRELELGARVLSGPPPAGLVPPVSDTELVEFIRDELRGYWLPVTAKRELWGRDIWVDAGMLTFARASVTLREGRLVTKREALDELRAQGAPAGVTEDIHRRRYGPPREMPIADDWLVQRGELAREFVRQGIERALGPAG
ncbi:nucleotidyltransferase domain-containing protein [Streptomyces sp. GMY02]|uniref:nucleotidyltransferase domain-containing protein n=1 Tax=Streptomyces sp. GMY02 TaxID=1333528 RepID=UPI001C2C0893|nr:nucleotidyltransferase domain-containing protein [Streptomyces sp. GMY02]QXE34893.1 nucleotidyltransferase domain-containing protein [Streptomyces sp. GMY02]